jgi:hypothetical protein
VQYTGTKSALSRRAFVGKLAAGTAAACVAGIGTAQAIATRRESSAESGDGQGHVALDPPPAHGAPQIVETSEPASPPPWEILHPLALGSAVAHGWSVAGLTGVADGSCVLTLQNPRGRAHRVHLCRNDGRPQGLVHTKQLDLVVMNGGQGDLPTEEGLAQAVAAVAHVLAANEGRHAPLAATLLPQAERTERFAAAAKLR